MELYHLIIEVFLIGDDIDRHIFNHLAMTPRQFHLMRFLAGGQQRHLSELATLLFCDKSNITGLIQRMEQQGLVERVTEVQDRRYVRVELTAIGEELYHHAAIQHERSIAERFSALSPEQVSMLEHTLKDVRQVLRTNLDSHNLPATPKTT